MNYNKPICYLLMTENQRKELMRQNSELYFKGYMTKHMHLNEQMRNSIHSLILEKGSVDPRKVLIVLQCLDESLGLKTEINEAQDRVLKEVLLKEFTNKTLNSIEKLRELSVIEKHEGYLIEHLEQMSKILS